MKKQTRCASTRTVLPPIASSKGGARLTLFGPKEARLAVAVAAAALIIYPSTAGAANVPMAKDGKLSKREYMQSIEKTFGKKPVKVRLRRTAAAEGSSTAASGSFVQVGAEDKGFIWDRKEEEISAIVFINAADPLGIFVENLRPGDRVTIKSASGIASFSDYAGAKRLASSFIGLVVAGGSIAKPELAPALKDAEKKANALFDALPSKGKRRDAFGRDPGSGHQARQEGGVIVCMPQGQVFYSDGRDRWGLSEGDRWITKGGPRTDNKLPRHIKPDQAFFLLERNAVPEQEYFRHQSRIVQSTSPLVILPWDHKFSDNQGFYRVHLHIQKAKPGSSKDDVQPVPRQTDRGGRPFAAGPPPGRVSHD